MNALIVFSALVAAANAGIIAAPYAGAYACLPYAAPLAYAQAPVIAKAAPVAVAPAPVAVAAAPAVPTVASSQYQAQDEFGNTNYGYSNINSAKQEFGNTNYGYSNINSAKQE